MDEQDLQDDITKLLLQWGYDATVIKKFKDEGIEPGHLRVMSEYSLEKLFPKIGDRTTFMMKIKTMEVEATPVPVSKKRRMSYDSDSTTLTNISSISHTSNVVTLEQLLDGPDGKIIMSFYNSDKMLNDYHRQKLADEIIRYELRHDIRKSLPNSVIEYWSDQIIKHFKEESYEVWVGSAKGRNRDSAAGRGVLLNRYYNMRRKLIKVGAITKTNNEVSRADVSIGDKHTDDETEQELDDVLILLQNSRTVTSVLENWEHTTTKRLSMLKGSMEIHQYMDNFPALKSFDGYRLLEMDFNNLYPNAAMQLYGDWPALSSFIIGRIPIKEQKAIDNCCTSDGKKVKTLRALALLFPIKNIVMKKKKQWRPSRLETMDGLFQYVKSAAEVLPANLRNKEKFSEMGLNLGPQLFAVSADEDNDNITDCFIVINQTLYNIDSPLKAFDIFFKVFHALHCWYPKQSERELYFLQRAVYNIMCASDNQVRDSKTTGLINEYNKFNPQ